MDKKKYKILKNILDNEPRTFKNLGKAIGSVMIEQEKYHKNIRTFKDRFKELFAKITQF